MIENPFEYGKLQGRIKEKCGIQNVFARDIGLSEVSVSNKLNNNVEWGQEKIEKAVKVLNIPTNEIHSYFFLIELRKIKQRRR